MKLITTTRSTVLVERVITDHHTTRIYGFMVSTVPTLGTDQRSCHSEEQYPLSNRVKDLYRVTLISVIRRVEAPCVTCHHL
jgi:hypothetical protein